MTTPTKRKTYPTAQNLTGIDVLVIDTGDGKKQLELRGLVVGADGNLVATDFDGTEDETTEVLAGQFWGVKLRSINTSSTCWPITLIYGPRVR